MTKNNTRQVPEKIKEILDECSKGSYIFRGEENEEYGEVSSGLYRQYCQTDQKSSKNPPIQNKYFSVVTVEKDIIEKVRQHIRPDAHNIEVLTELQHYGGKTALIDFTKDIHIALFFACDGSFNKDGRVILFETLGVTEKPEVDYEQIDNNEKKQTYTLVSPTGKSSRVIFQSSIFIHAFKGYLEEEKYKTIKIEKDIKRPLLNYLSKHFNIKTETVYNDIQGFIRNQNNHSTAEIEFYRGLAMQEDGKFKEAIERYEEAIELNPQNYEAYQNRGIVCYELGQHEEAIQDYNKAIELNPQNDGAYQNRGNAYFRSGQHEEAIQDYNKAIELNPQNDGAYQNRGNVYFRSWQHEEAIQDYNKAIELNPQNYEAYQNRGNVYFRSGQHEEAIQDYNKAIQDYNKAIELNPQNYEAYQSRGNAYLCSGQHEEAIQDYNKAIELNPQNYEAYQSRGNAYLCSGQHEEAIQDYNKALELNPQLAEVYYSRGKVKVTLGQNIEAIKDFTEAKTLFEKTGDITKSEICEKELHAQDN